MKDQCVCDPGFAPDADQGCVAVDLPRSLMDNFDISGHSPWANLVGGALSTSCAQYGRAFSMNGFPVRVGYLYFCFAHK